MTSPIVNNAVTVLAHRRLTWLRDALRRRLAITEIQDDFDETLLNAGGTAYGKWFRRQRMIPVTHGDVEEQVAVLAERAIALLEGGPPVRPGGGSIGTYAVLGGGAYDWFGYADLMNRNSGWLGNVVRRGSPDPGMSHMIAPTLRLAIRSVELGVPLAVDPAEAAKIRAFGMGMICSVAANVLVNPVLRGATAGRRADDGPYIDPHVATLLGDACAKHVLELQAPGDYHPWWPTSLEIPEALINGMINAINELGDPFGPGRPHGFADFERAFQITQPPPPAVVRQVLPAVRTDDRWGYGWWLLLFTPFGLTMGAALPLTVTWPFAKHMFLKETPEAANRKSRTEVMTFTQSLAFLGPMCATIYLRGKLPGNTALDLGIATTVVDILALIFAFVTLGVDVDEGWRWLVWALPLAIHAAWLVYAAVGTNQPTALRWYAFIQGWPLIASLFSWAYAEIINKVSQDKDTESGAKDVSTGMLIGFGLVMLGLPFLFAGLLKGPSLLARMSALPALPAPPGPPPPPPPPPRLPGFDTMANLAALGAVTSTPVAPARLFDESTLWVGVPPANAADPVGLAALRYPPGNRPLLKLWWTGAGALEVSPGGDRLRHRVGGGAPVLVVLPPAALTPAQLAGFLEAQIVGLRTAPVLAEADAAATHPLPYPALIADAGEVFSAVGVTEERAFVLRHASRAQLAAAIGRDGPAVTAAEGWPVGPSSGRIGDDGTAVGLAADLAALLCLGAASQLHDGPLAFTRPAGGPGPLARVTQVFRQWNLDERRLNEWQMLVAGNAFREKPDPVAAAPDEIVPAAGDDAMLPNAAPSPPVRAGTSALSDALGWIPAFRAWARVAGDIEQDPIADLAAPYTPLVQIGAGNRTQPTNRSLTEVMRYLLDLPR